MPQPVSVRMDEELVVILKRIARRRSYSEDRDVTWADILNEAARRLARAEGQDVLSPTCEQRS
jgi:hypothetical protein